mgnify:CR=1 FL=1
MISKSTIDLKQTLIEVKTERLVNNLTREFIKDGYHLVSYDNSLEMGHIEVYLKHRENMNQLRIASLFSEQIIKI